MKVLFLLLHPGYVRNYEGVITSLAERGHEVHLAFSQPAKQSSDRIAERLAEAQPGITFGVAPKPTHGVWRSFAWGIRGLGDYARYVDPEYASATLLRERVAHRVRRSAGNFDPITVRWVLGVLSFLEGQTSARVSRGVISLLGWLEDVIPPSPKVLRFVDRFEPDVVLVTPLVNIASVQVDFLKAAKGLGIPNALCVASWDNLTNKGLIREEPDAIIVWNEAQRDEAVRLHRMPASKVVVTGAQRFDEWFEQRPSRDREQFCREAGLDPARPYVLYLCSSPFIAPDEVSYVRRWLRAVRSEGTEGLRSAGVLIRLHPQNVAQWKDVDLSDTENVSIWPRGGPQPVDPASRSDFWDSMVHSAAVVGVNTSALIEAAIAGRSVFTLRDPAFAGTQDGTLHFKYLEHEHGGPLHVADSLEQHLHDLEQALEGDVEEAAHIQRFLTSFLRPAGLDQAATPLVLEAVEKLMVTPRPRSKTSPAHVLVRLLLTPFVTITSGAGLAHTRRAALRSGKPALTRLVRRTRLRLPGAGQRHSGGASQAKDRDRTRNKSKEVLRQRRRKTASRRRWLRRMSRRPLVGWVARRVMPLPVRDHVRRRLSAPGRKA